MTRSSKSEVLRAHCAAIAEEETILREGGGKAGHDVSASGDACPYASD